MNYTKSCCSPFICHLCKNNIIVWHNQEKLCFCEPVPDKTSVKNQIAKDKIPDKPKEIVN
jgi:hypothetical protein